MAADTFELNGKNYGDVQYLDREALTQQPGMNIAKGRYVLAREIEPEASFPRLIVGDWVQSCVSECIYIITAESMWGGDYRAVTASGEVVGLERDNVEAFAGVVKRDGEVIWQRKDLTALTGTNKDESMKAKTKPTTKKKNSAKGKSTKKK